MTTAGFAADRTKYVVLQRFLGTIGVGCVLPGGPRTAHNILRRPRLPLGKVGRGGCGTDSRAPLRGASLSQVDNYLFILYMQGQKRPVMRQRARIASLI